MIRLYRVDNTKNSDIKGYWLEKKWLRKNIIHIDNIQIITFKTRQEADKDIKTAFDNGENAVFYIVDNNKAIIEDKKGHIITLHDNFCLNKTFINNKAIKFYFEKYGGLTIFNLKPGYKIEIWY